MKKLNIMVALLAVLAMVFTMAPVASFAEDTYEIALITDVGNIDDKSFNQGTWEGVVEYATANNITYAYYRPSEDSTEARVEQIKAAIDKGAKIIVMPGYLFVDAIIETTAEYPEVTFIAVDVDPAANGITAPTANSYFVIYKEEQAGFLAGYAAVMDGYTKLGFLGGIAVPAVVRYGSGFVQGADAAAKEMNADVSIKYWYSDSFSATDDIKNKMDSWYADGTQIVFSCGGGIYLSALSAAETAGGKVIGVDVDQSAESEIIITSAMKELKGSVVSTLAKIYENGGTLPADMQGATSNLGVESDAVGLPTAEASWRFATFTVENYTAVLEKVKSGEITINNAIDENPVVEKVTVDYQN